MTMLPLHEMYGSTFSASSSSSSGSTSSSKTPLQLGSPLGSPSSGAGSTPALVVVVTPALPHPHLDPAFFFLAVSSKETSRPPPGRWRGKGCGAPSPARARKRYHGMAAWTLVASLASCVVATPPPGYKLYDNNDLPSLIASADMSVPSGRGVEFCAGECGKRGDDCSAFVYYATEQSCTLRNQDEKEIREGMHRSATAHVYLRTEMPAFWFHEHSDSLKLLQALVREHKISATDPNAMKLYANLQQKGQISMQGESGPGFFSRAIWFLLQLLWAVAVLLLVGGTGYLLWTKFGESATNFVSYKLLAPIGLKKQPAYTPQELAAMWDHDDDGL